MLDTCRTVTPERKGWARQESVTIREMRSLPGASGTPEHHRTIHASARTFELRRTTCLVALAHSLHLGPTKYRACEVLCPAWLSRR